MPTLVFNLIAIALAIVVTLAAMIYTGSTLTDASARTEALRYLRAAEQVVAAAHMYQMDYHAYPATVEELVPKYLARVPEGEWAFEDGYARDATVSAQVCLAANKSAGIEETPGCDEADVMTPCCVR